MRARPGREDASATVWRWRGEPEEGAARRARLGGLARGLAGAAIGVAALWLGHPRVAWIAWGVSGVGVALALASPLGAYAAVVRGLAAVGRGVGRVVGWALLTPTYLLVFVPFRALARRGARDRLRRRLDPGAASYWEPRPEDRQVRSMKRPY